jgi:hypothetical protein
VKWHHASFPSWQRGFDSRRPLVVLRKLLTSSIIGLWDIT